MRGYRASKLDCDACALKHRCCPNVPDRKILRSIHEGAHDIAATDAYVISRRERKKVETLFAHLKQHYSQLLAVGRLLEARSVGGSRNARLAIEIANAPQ